MINFDTAQAAAFLIGAILAGVALALIFARQKKGLVAHHNAQLQALTEAHASDKSEQEERAQRELSAAREQAAQELFRTTTNLEQKMFAEVTRVAQEKDATISQLSAQIASLAASKENLEKQLTTSKLEAESKMNLLKEFEPLKAQVAQMGNKLKEMDELSLQQYGQMQETLQITKNSTSKLDQATSQLKEAFTSTKTAGVWAEESLERLVEVSGMIKHVDFKTQVSLDRGNKADMIINLPGDRKVIVDAKTQYGEFKKISDNPSKDEIDNTWKNIAKNLRTMITDMNKRNYPEKIAGSIDSTIIYLPNDTFLINSLAVDPGLNDYGHSKNIILTSPSSLFAVLKSFSIAWERETVRTEMQNIYETCRVLCERLEKFTEYVAKIGAGLTNATKAYNDAVSSYNGRLAPQVRKIGEINENTFPKGNTNASQLESVEVIVRDNLKVPKEITNSKDTKGNVEMPVAAAAETAGSAATSGWTSCNNDQEKES
ncbi:DNA recombination protein RmuC [Canibacter sp. lx-45]|uniref:DNA recombination protein RmuC n=1 Tax=Canibacter zhuwentaonis TaxID=2837491 RepID=UPI001BDC93C4|nr:DNA recombination protein RmuC [Canibacter zhuwentaonis]MBT1035918.1 DNA recombination protein RmuC [Canibacter zhuwentaonis]